MKKVFIVSKTHLDLGFTDFAENIRKKYIDVFIPGAIQLAQQVNSADSKYFVWTVGSWILKEALDNGSDKQRKTLEAAIAKGDIAPHAMPFTTHTELLDYDTLDYGLSIVDRIDKIRGSKTIAAKMTDVPGHTKGIVKMLAQHGIKLLHIGVNGASAVPDVPECFLWKNGGYEIVVIYSGDYGGAFKSPLAEEVLYLDHTFDNQGAPSPKQVKHKFEQIQKAFPDYEITAGTLDDFAAVIWEVRDKLPVIENEIGDTWIHGSAADPYKSAALRELMSLKCRWLADGTMQKGSSEYIGFTDALLCIGEHTCGVDNKKYFADYENYLKIDFQKARKRDKVSIRHPFRDFPQNLLTIISRISGAYESGSYSYVEKSWKEQRAYITSAVSFLENSHKIQAEKVLSSLIPNEPREFPAGKAQFCAVSCGKWSFKLNKYGGIGKLLYNDDEVIKDNNKPVVEYHSYSDKDYGFWLNNYTRDLEHTKAWAIGDFARPLLKYVSGKYPVGRFPYFADRSVLDDSAQSNPKVCVDLKCDSELCSELGAPRMIQIVYSLSENGLQIDLSWYGKDANRLSEVIYMHLFPSSGDIKLRKLNDTIEPSSVVSKGSRNLHAVFSTELKTDKNCYRFLNFDSPIVSVGKGKILEFDNKFESVEKDGISYVLYNNVWGTNFPLWYEENAKFRFFISAEE